MIRHGPDQGQQPDGDETPGVAVAPVALAGAIMAGFARLMLTVSLHVVEFGVGMTVMFGLMIVSASSVITG
jgi:H+/Cl- antiporter ClcA